MYRFLLRPKWIAFTLGIVLLIFTMINLGLWQLRRLDQRRESNTAVEQRYDQTPRPLDSVLTPGADPESLQWLPVTVVGTYRPEGTVQIVNRSQNGFAGDNIVVPFDLGDGRVLLVNRGFLPLGEDVPPPPSAGCSRFGIPRPRAVATPSGRANCRRRKWLPERACDQPPSARHTALSRSAICTIGR